MSDRTPDESRDKPFPERPTKGRYGRKWHDGKAPDGFVVNGWRKIAKDGTVRFQQARRYHEILTRYPGCWVFVELVDGWGVEADFFLGQPWKTYGIRMETLSTDGVDGGHGNTFCEQTPPPSREKGEGEK
jgi:hypothetical protein